MNRLYSVFFLPLVWLFPAVDCPADFSCKAVSGNGKGGRSLELTLSQGSSEQYTLELYDFNTGNIVSRKSVYFSVNESKVVFEKVKPSTYTVYFTSASCPKKRPIKVKEGIVVQ
jgi:hypothetical protein